MMWPLDDRLSPVIHQIIGIAMGVIFCSWFLGATSEQVAFIRLPSTIALTAYVLANIVFMVFGAYRSPRA